MDQPNLVTKHAIGFVLLGVYLSLFLIVPFFAIYKGWVYIMGCFFFSLGLRWQIVQIIKRGHIKIGFHLLILKGLSWKQRDYIWIGRKIPIKNEQRFTTFLTVCLVTAALVIVPTMVFVMGNQALVLSNQIEQNTTELTDAIRSLVAVSNERFGTKIELGNDSGLKSLFERVAGDTINDVKNFFKHTLKSIAESVALFFGDWVKVTISTFIISTFMSPSSYSKAVQGHRRIITMGFQNTAVRNTILRSGEIFQEMLGQFMVGYLEVALRLTLMFFAIIYLLLPSGLTLLAAAGISIFLGTITAIPKIGGLIGMIIGFILMSLNLKTGFGWFGYELISTNSAFVDTLIRMVMLGVTAKILGLFEAYKFTPEIVGKKLGLDKIQIVFVVVMYAFGGFYWMIWGIIGLCFLATAIKITEEVDLFWKQTS